MTFSGFFTDYIFATNKYSISGPGLADVLTAFTRLARSELLENDSHSVRVVSCSSLLYLLQRI